MRRSSSAASSEHGDSCFCQSDSGIREFLRTYVESVGDRIGQTCIGLGDHGKRRESAQPFQNGIEFLRTERAVYADGVSAETFQHSSHTFRRNTGECAHILLK